MESITEDLALANKRAGSSSPPTSPGRRASSKTRAQLAKEMDEVTGPNANLAKKRDYSSRRNKEYDDAESMDEDGD